MYMAWLCYPHSYDSDDQEIEPKIEFEDPSDWKYEKVIPIQFTVLHQWSRKDKAPYK